MNVAFDPWIPVVTLDGEPKLVSLCYILTEGHLLADIAVRPHERVALMRLFLCVSHAALDGPKDYEDWCEVPKRLPDAAKKYLEAWMDSFELLHSTKPWLQIVGLESGKSAEEGWGPVSKLGFFMASGANTTLFDHEGMNNERRKIDLSSTVLSLLTFQCFSPGGLISQVMWNGLQTSKSSKDGPCVSASMVHALLRRENLLLSIQANLPTYENVSFAYNGRPFGHPVWELMPSSFVDNVAVNNATQTYLGRLVPLTRVARIHHAGAKMLMGDGLAYPPFTEGFPAEPTAVTVVRFKDKKPEHALLSYRPGRAIWRELASIIVRRSVDNFFVGGPLSLYSLSEGDACDLIVAALARDQATILDTTESIYHIPARLRSQDGLKVYELEVKESEDLAKRLGWAIEDYRKTLDGGWEGRLKNAGPGKNDLLAKLHESAFMLYWTMIEKRLGLLMVHIDSLGSDLAESTLNAWHTMLWQAARDAYQSVCGQETPRQIKAFTVGWKKLHSKPKEQDETSKMKGAEK